MKIFVPSKGRAGAISTPLLLSGADYKVVLHNEEEKAEYIKRSPHLEPYIVVSGVPYGISEQRNWILNNLVSDGEWFCSIDDNVKGFNKFPDDVYFEENLPYEASKRREWERERCDITKLNECFNECIDKAESIGAKFIGFATIDNAYFRKKKWKQISMICSKMCLVKKCNLRYNENIKTMDDYCYSADCLKLHGKVLVNSYIRPLSTHNNAGGLGTLSERGENKIKDCKYLMESYPGLFRYKDRKNSLPMAEVVLRGYSESFLNKWKYSNGK